MGRLVIDGTSVYEIDEDCVRKNHPPKECGIYEHLKDLSESDVPRITEPPAGQRRRRRGFFL